MKKISTQNLPTIVLIGRANVGKSTLFNSLIEQHKAIVSDIAGTTRTNNEGLLIWRGKEAHLIDTGGVDNDENERFASAIIAQADMALKQSDMIIMLTDAKIGVMPQEKELAKKLTQTYKDKKIYLLANKADTKKIEMNLGEKEWMSLGLGMPIP
ncbi:MAG: 50S ribosome-binding GTPase, partial [Candidatus Magasanikbacteria bacterium]|nr:50S ribosome-binding GTPase [Candidatus Magasanikbacteria bacterium]